MFSDGNSQTRHGRLPKRETLVMGHIPATIGRCRICGIGVVVRYIGKDGILCLEHKRMVKEHNLDLKKSVIKVEQVLIPTDKMVTVVKDEMPVAEGGFYPGQKFGGFDADEMFKHCSFTDGTIVSIEGSNYIVRTVEMKDGNQRQVPIPHKKGV